MADDRFEQISARVSAEPVGYYCDHADELVRTHHSWEHVEGEGFVFQHQPNTISAHTGLEEYLSPEKREIRCPRALPVYAGDVPALRTELEKYVGKEPTRDEEAQYVNRCLDAVYDACETARRDGRVLTVEEIEQAADGNRPGARKLLTETLAKLADRAHRVAASHQRFIEEHADPGTEALGAQYELAHALIAIEEQSRPEPGAEPDIPWATARHVLWMFGEDGGMRPGSFTEQLINTCARADVTHLARLRQAYPAEAHAVHLAKNTEDGITRLQTIAGGVA